MNLSTHIVEEPLLPFALERPAARLMILCALLLGGCGHMPLGSMVALSKIDFATTDPAAMRAAIKLPRGLRPVEPMLTIVVAGKDGSRHERSVPLLPIDDEAAEDVADVTAAQRLFAFRFSAQDAARVAAFRSEMLANKQGGGSLTLNIGAKACNEAAEPWSGPVVTSSYLRTSETGRYVVLAKDVDLRTAAREAGVAPKAADAPLAPCA